MAASVSSQAGGTFVLAEQSLVWAAEGCPDHCGNLHSSFSVSHSLEV